MNKSKSVDGQHEGTKYHHRDKQPSVAEVLGLSTFSSPAQRKSKLQVQVQTGQTEGLRKAVDVLAQVKALSDTSQVKRTATQTIQSCNHPPTANTMSKQPSAQFNTVQGDSPSTGLGTRPTAFADLSSKPQLDKQKLQGQAVNAQAQLTQARTEILLLKATVYQLRSELSLSLGYRQTIPGQKNKEGEFEEDEAGTTGDYKECCWMLEKQRRLIQSLKLELLKSQRGRSPT